MSYLSSTLASLAGIGANQTRDTILVFAVVAAMLFYGLSVGRRRIASSILYLYVASSLLAVIPVDRIAAVFGVRELWRAEVGAFLILFTVLFLLLGRGRLFGLPSGRRWWQVLLLALSGAGLLIRIIIGLLPDALRAGFSPLIQGLFVSSAWTSAWHIAPLLVLVFIRWVEGWDE